MHSVFSSRDLLYGNDLRKEASKLMTVCLLLFVYGNREKRAHHHKLGMTKLNLFYKARSATLRGDAFRGRGSN